MQKSQITIISSEGRQVSVNRDFGKLISYPIRDGIIVLSTIKMPAILKIIEFAQHHSYSPFLVQLDQPLKAFDIKKIVREEWDSNFFKSLRPEVVVDMINACEILGYKSLSELCQAYVATLFKSMNIEELKLLFKIDPNLSESEDFNEEKIQHEFSQFNNS